MSDQNFDSIAQKFQQNIYGTTKGRLRHEVLTHFIDKLIPLKAGMHILDAGGGTGELIDNIYEPERQITLNDISADALEIAKQRLPDNVTIHQGELQDIVGTQSWDVIFCHAVLEWLVNPLDVLPLLVNNLKSGGYLSLSFFNQDAKLFSNAIYGNFEYIDNGLKVRNTVRLNPKNPQKPAEVLNALEALDVDVLHTAGVRCFHDYVLNKAIYSERYEDLRRVEIEYATQEPFKWLGRYFHIILRKR